MCFGEDQDNAAYFRQQQERIITALTKPLQRAMASGVIQKLEPRAVAHMIMGNIQGLQIHMILVADKTMDGESCPVLPPEEAATFLTTMLMDGLEGRSQDDAL